MIAPAAQSPEPPAGPRRDPAQKLVPWCLGGEKEMAVGNIIITAARMRAHGRSWESVAEKTGRPARELMQFMLKNPEVWEPLSARAEKVRLQEAEGRMLRRLVKLAADGTERERQRAAEELLVHRRFIARGRNRPPRRQEELRDEKPRPGIEKAPYPAWLVREPPPEGRDIFYAAHCLSRGAAWEVAAKDMKEPLDGVLLWPFIHPASWDRAYIFARLESARAAAALAVNELQKLADYGSDQAALRAARALLVHRRHMSFAQRRRDAFVLTAEAPRREEELRDAARNPNPAGDAGREESADFVSWCPGATKENLGGLAVNPRGPSARPRDGPR